MTGLGFREIITVGIIPTSSSHVTKTAPTQTPEVHNQTHTYPYKHIHTQILRYTQQWDTYHTYIPNNRTPTHSQSTIFPFLALTPTSSDDNSRTAPPRPTVVNHVWRNHEINVISQHVHTFLPRIMHHVVSIKKTEINRLSKDKHTLK